MFCACIVVCFHLLSPFIFSFFVPLNENSATLSTLIVVGQFSVFVVTVYCFHDLILFLLEVKKMYALKSNF